MPFPGLLSRTCIFLLGFLASAVADTVILKSGEKIEGRILEETPTEVTVEIQATPTIKDQRIIPREEISNIRKVQPDEEAWKPLQGLALGEESFEVADYQAVALQLGRFISDFPNSSFAPVAKDKLAQFEAERKRVEAGEIKEKGGWLSKEQVAEERVQISGRVMVSRMKRFAARGQLTEAMNVFDALDKNFPGSAAMVEAIELARQIVPQIKSVAEQQKQRLAAIAAENKNRIDAAQSPEKEQIAAAVRNQTAAAEAAVAAVERTGVRWMPLNPSTERSLAALISRANADSPSLNNRPLEKMRQSIAAAETARTAIQAKNVPAAEKALQEASSTWSANELAKRLQPRLAEARKEAAALAAAEAKAREAAKKATPKPAPTPTPIAVIPPEPPTEPSLFAKPIFWVILAVLGLFGSIGYIAYQKFRDPSKNLLDQ